MSAMIRAGRSKDGRILVLDETGFVASYVGGKWEPKILFTAQETYDNLIKVKNLKEVRYLWRQARKGIRKEQTLVTHIDMAKNKLGFTRFNIKELAETIKVSYSLARKYLLEWVEEGEVHKFQRLRPDSSQEFQFMARKLTDWEVKPNESVEWKGEDLFTEEESWPYPPMATEEEVEELVQSYLQYEDLAPSPIKEPSVGDILSEIMEVSQAWKDRALLSERENAQIKLALSDFLKGLKQE